MKENEIRLTQEMINAVQILKKKTEYKLSLAESHRDTIEWELSEAELYAKAKKIIENQKD